MNSTSASPYAHRRFLNRGVIAPIALALLAIGLAISNPFFLTLSNLLNVGGQVGPLSIVAIGEMFVLVTGGFDISVGSTSALAAVCAAYSVSAIGTPGLFAAPVAGAVVGFANGALVGWLQIPPVIATVGTLSLVRAVALVLAGDHAVVVNNAEELSVLGYGKILGVPAGFGIAVILMLMAMTLAQRTRLGRRLYMIGSNQASARLVGVRIPATIVSAYLLSGLCAGIAAVFFVARAGAGLPTIGGGLALSAIAAAVIGGTALTGGVGSPVLVFFGAVFIQCLNNSLDLAGLSPFVKEVVLGIVILVAGLVDFGVKRLGSITLVARGPLNNGR